MGEPEGAPAEQGYRLAVLQPGAVFPERVRAEVPERAEAVAGPATQGRGVSGRTSGVSEAGRGREVRPVDKQILYQYIDACELVKETEREIEQIRRRRQEIVTDKVKMSDYDFPFGQISCTIHGIPYDAQDCEMLDRKERILKERKAAAETIKLQVEEWLVTVPLRMQRIIRYKVFEGMTWAQVAQRMGRKNTENGLKKEFERFMRAA